MNNVKRPALLITGATGNIGSQLVKQLVLKGVSFRVMVRPGTNMQEQALPGVEIVEGDFNDAASTARALQGIDRAFLLTNSSEQAETLQTDFVKTATKAGVKHLVKLSQFASDAHSPVRFLRYHAAVERQIIQSGLSYTFLRPNLFMQGLLGFRESIKTQGKFFAAIGDAAISMVDTRDIAAVAVAALTGNGHEGKIYNITGPEALTHQQAAAGLSQELGRPINFINVPPEAMQQALLSAGFPRWQAEGLIEDYAHYARGEAAAVFSTVQDVTGKPARHFSAFANDYAPAFM